MIKELNFDLQNTRNRKTFSLLKYLGSMFLLDAGEKMLVRDKRKNREYIQGEISISVRECFWDIFQNDIKILSCEDELSNKNMSFLVNKSIQEFSIKNDNFIISLSESIHIACDLSNQAGLEDGEEFDDTIIAVSFLKRNKIYHINTYGKVALADE